MNFKYAHLGRFDTFSSIFSNFYLSFWRSGLLDFIVILVI